jgi:endonuclease YncB( thermonuclease family)
VIRRLRLLLPFLVLAALVLPADHAQAAFRAKCVPGDAASPSCTWWNARVTFISDGDSIDARVGRRVHQIRLTGINAMELQRYSKYPERRRGDCHGLEATAFIERYIKRSRFRIRLAAQRASSRSGRRLRRSVWVRSGGRWRDLARLELAAGHALWLPAKDEWAHNGEYARLAAGAVAARRNLYDPGFCGAGPDQDLPVSIAVHWDADGDDEGNLNGEYVDIRNGGSRPLSLAGWFFRDSFLRFQRGTRTPGFVFPAATVVPAGGSVRLRAGCGSSSARDLHWCLDGTAFENVTGGPRHVGDGGYLFDPRGNLRASFLYPCLVACADAAAGRVRLDPHPNRPEAITILNTSGRPVDLSDHILKLRNRGKAAQYVFGHVFGPGTELPAGGVLQYTPDTPNRFSDNGGVVELRTLDDSLTDCAAWGFGRC